MTLFSYVPYRTNDVRIAKLIRRTLVFLYTHLSRTKMFFLCMHFCVVILIGLDTSALPRSQRSHHSNQFCVEIMSSIERLC